MQNQGERQGSAGKRVGATRWRLGTAFRCARTYSSVSCVKRPLRARPPTAPPMKLTHFVAVVLLLTAACSQREDGLRHEYDVQPQPSPAQLEQARAAFDVVYAVLQHPRCLNCHPDGDRPLQSDTSRPHAMNVVRGPDDRGVSGMLCAGCHGTSNSTLAFAPPGVSGGWRMAPRTMRFEGLSKSELASMLLDPYRTHMTTEEMIEHVEHDPLVLWGWDPGPGRKPVPVAHADFVTAFQTWIEAGAPVPAEDD